MIKVFMLICLLLVMLGSDISFVSQGVYLTQTQSNLFIPLVNRGDIDLFISGVKIIQGTTMSDGYQVHIADRDTIMRVFVGLEGGSKVTGISGMACGYDQAGVSLGCIPPDNDSIKAPSYESTLKRTLNFHLPDDWVKPGNAYYVEIDPQHHIADGNPDNNRYPEHGVQLFNFVNAPPLDVVVIPVEYRPYLFGEIFSAQIDDLSYLTPYPMKLLPIPEAKYQPHTSISYFPSLSDHNLDTSLGWELLLNIITSVHDMEDPPGEAHYYGLVNSYDAHGCDGGCITGVANLKGRDAVGWSGLGEGTVEASKTLVHELGHNFGRKHVLCTGSEVDIDNRYPYPDASIGQFGLDVQESLLYDPAIYKSFMSYCLDTWTSDYTYWNIFNYRQTRLGINLQREPQVEAIYVRGLLSSDGEATLLPVYQQFGSIKLATTGSYSLDLLDSHQNVLKTYIFEMNKNPDAPGYQHFGFFVPAAGGMHGLRLRLGDQILAEKTVTTIFDAQSLGKGELVIEAAGDRVFVRWPEVSHPVTPVYYRLRLSEDDGRTWQVLTLDWPETSFLMPSGFGNSLLEVQASDGVHTTTRIYSLDLSP